MLGKLFIKTFFLYAREYEYRPWMYLRKNQFPKKMFHACIGFVPGGIQEREQSVPILIFVVVLLNGVPDNLVYTFPTKTARSLSYRYMNITGIIPGIWDPNTQKTHMQRRTKIRHPLAQISLSPS